MLEIKNLTKIFDNNKTAVNDINVTINNGEFISVIGYSGSGKSTFLNLISGLLQPTSGEILFDGKNINSLNDKEISALRNDSIGYIMQGNSLMPNLTVEENILLPVTFSQTKHEFSVEDVLKDVGILDLKNKYPSEISGGEAKRCAIARALLLKPKLLLADEPVSDLDPENTNIIMKVFSNYVKKGMSVIMVTHNMETTKCTKTIYKMDNGHLSKTN